MCTFPWRYKEWFSVHLLALFLLFIQFRLQFFSFCLASQYAQFCGLTRLQGQWRLQHTPNAWNNALKGTDVQTPKYTHTNRSENRKKANIPIGIKVCTIYLNPWSGWKLFCIADVVIRLSEHCRSKPKAIRVVAARAYTREEKNKKKRTEFMYTCYYGGISFNLIWVIRIFGVSIINICLSQLLTHLIRLS